MNTTPPVATPIVVNPSALPTMGGVIVRYAAALLAGWLIRRGVLADSDAALVEGLLLAVATVSWAAWRAWQRKAQIVAMEPYVPDHIATTKDKAGL